MMIKPLLKPFYRLAISGALITAAFVMPGARSMAASRASPAIAPPIPPDDPRITYNLALVTNNVNRPVFITHAGDNRLFIVEQGGYIRIWQSGSMLPTPFLDVHTLIPVIPAYPGYSEQGLLGLAFEPDFATTKRFYIYYNTTGGDIALARYNVSANPNVADSNSGQVIMTIPHPSQSNHNGGWITFGPDNNLYLGPGDGGGANDQYCNAQNVTKRLGKLLRIDVIGQVTYTIPASNVFTPTQAPEVWAIGLRNPFRNSFDRLTGDMYVADVGQNAWEEVNYVPAGSGAGINFGWSQYEGTAPFNSGCPHSSIPPTMPVVVHAHSVTGDDNCSITGGYVYRGLSQWWLYGDYFYGDWCSGRIWALWQPTPGVFSNIQVTDTTHRIASFGEDVSGEIYVADLAGAVYQLTSTVTGVTPTNLTSVSVTGPASGVTMLPYTFSATANPVSATLPLLYTWQADDHTMVIHTGGLSDSVTFDWAISGTKVITVTARNAGGSVVEDTHTIVIAEAQKYYFPLILRD